MDGSRCVSHTVSLSAARLLLTLGPDSGEKSRELFKKAISESKTILWNGPAGVFEFENFAGGSKATLDACIEAASNGSTVIIGGGDTATVVASESSRTRTLACS